MPATDAGSPPGQIGGQHIGLDYFEAGGTEPLPEAGSEAGIQFHGNDPRGALQQVCGEGAGPRADFHHQRLVGGTGRGGDAMQDGVLEQKVLSQPLSGPMAAPKAKIRARRRGLGYSNAAAGRSLADYIDVIGAFKSNERLAPDGLPKSGGRVELGKQNVVHDGAAQNCVAHQRLALQNGIILHPALFVELHIQNNLSARVAEWNDAVHAWAGVNRTVGMS